MRTEHAMKAFADFRTDGQVVTICLLAGEETGFGGFRVTKRDLQRRITSKAHFPYDVEYRTKQDEDFRIHSRIQTPTDERMFENHANRKAQYRVVE